MPLNVAQELNPLRICDIIIKYFMYFSANTTITFRRKGVFLMNIKHAQYMLTVMQEGSITAEQAVERIKLENAHLFENGF